MSVGKDKLLECVPNFSVGDDEDVISELTNAITSTEGVKLLNVDVGVAANRTVFTFVGNPCGVETAVLKAARVAERCIDMSKHKGVHPRLGAMDVCPVIPVLNATLEDANTVALKIAYSVGSELGIPVYLYEYSSGKDYRKRLEQIRHGEYEGLKTKINIPGWQPDFGPSLFNVKSGATVVGARNYLIAFNVNLETKQVKIAQRIAEDIRESGKLVSDMFTGEVKRVPGILKHVKALGWYIKDFDVVQVSTNITNHKATPLHVVFETIRKVAQSHNTKVVGSELIGLLPANALIDAGKYYSKHLTIAPTTEELIEMAVKELKLDIIKPFDAQRNIVEYASGIHVSDVI